MQRASQRLLGALSAARRSESPFRAVLSLTNNHGCLTSPTKQVGHTIRRGRHARWQTNSSDGDRPTDPPHTQTADDEHDPMELKFPDPTDPNQHPLASLAAEEVKQDLNLWRKNKSQNEPPSYTRKLTEDGEAFAIGRRKRSEARVWLRQGTGSITVNETSWVDYFPRLDHRDKILRPLDVLGVVGKFDVRCKVAGGGVNGQTEAVRHGIARAMQNWDPYMRPTLKQEGLLTRDSRIVEPKKYGRKKARKSFQWVKR